MSNNVMAVALSGMQTDLAQLQKVSANMANSATPGYKREITGTTPFSQIINDLSSIDVLANVKSTIDMRQGALQKTTRSLDLAIQGNGLFEVQTPNGLAYTRRGSFQLDSQGRIVTDQGFPLIGDKGEIRVQSANVEIDSNGAIYHLNDNNDASHIPVGHIKLVGFEKPADIIRDEHGLFRPTSEDKLIRETNVQIQQGYLENSNTSTAQEMIQMMKTMRHFESMQKIAQSHDEMLGMAIRKFGEF